MQFQLTKNFIGTLKQKIEAKDREWILQNVIELHHADIADVLEELSNDEAKYVYYLSDEDVQADILMDLQDESRDRFIESLSTKELANQMEHLDSDDAADILGELSEEEIQEVISQMQDDSAAEAIVDLLNYDEDIAGGLMQKAVSYTHLTLPTTPYV